MIACMIISICAVVLNRLGFSWWWLVVSGAFAINTYYFKPTGVSVIIAVIVYFLASLVSRRRSLFQTGSDFCGFIFGMAAGLIPLVIFYTWQGQLKVIVNGFPGSAVFPTVLLTAAGVSLYYAAGSMRSRGLFSVVGERTAAIAGSLAGVVVIAILIFCLRGRIAGIFTQIAKLINPSGGYVKASRESITFMSQYDNIMTYYGSFVIPIGLSLAAIFWRLKSSLCGLFAGKQEGTDPESPRKESFILLFSLWWILDMLFVWVSPRSYVQYYLPLNASAAALAAFAIHRCQQRSVGLVWLLAIWLAVGIVIKWVVPSETFPYIAIRSADAMKGGGRLFFPPAIALAIGIGIYWFGKVTNSSRVCVVTTALLCCGMFFPWNTANLQWFEKRMEACKRPPDPWVQLSEYIRDNTSADDTIYVWGWIPGIYVKSQRFAPTPRPSYSDMHTDTPAVISRLIRKTMDALEANPPKYIVDTQKIHFPYYEHPNFDLWPSWADKEKKKFHVRIFPQHAPVGARLFTLADMEKFKLSYNKYIEEYTYKLLRNPKRKGGSVQEQRAREMAVTEKKRHKRLRFLRKFVMENYRLVRISAGQCILYERKYNIDD